MQFIQVRLFQMLKDILARQVAQPFKLAVTISTALQFAKNYLETVIDWISESRIEDYMVKHQHDSDARTLWNLLSKSH